MRPVIDEHPFAAFGLPGRPGGDAFWAAARTPVSIPADDGWRTLFLWRGSEAVLDFESWSSPVPLHRWGGTDCWYAEVRMPARLRVTYRVLAGAWPMPILSTRSAPGRTVPSSRRRTPLPSPTGPPSARTTCFPSPVPGSAGAATGSAGGAPCASTRRAEAVRWCCCSTGTTGCICTRP